MPSVAERTRNNIRAGVFVSIALLLALATIIAVTDAWRALFYRMHEYRVTFNVASGVNNLKQGSEVRVGGVLFGDVTKIEPLIDDGQPFNTIEVTFRLDDRISLFSDAKVFVTSPLIGSEAWLSIPFVGNPTKGEPMDGMIEGSESVGMLTTLLGPANAAKANEMVENTRKFSVFLKDVPAEYDQRVVPILDDAGEAVKDIRGLASTIRHDNWPGWSDRVDQVMTWAGDATVKLDAVFDEGQGLLADARGMVNDNRPQIDTIVDHAEVASENIRDASDHINTETLAKVDKFLDTGQEGIESAKTVIETIGQDYDRWAVDVSDALADLRLTGQQLKLASIEVRRSPWKLLYRPSADELEHEQLYEAARAFASAAADLKAASASAQRILDNHADQLVEDQEAFERLQDYLLGSIDRYDKAQRDLFDVLLVDAPE